MKQGIIFVLTLLAPVVLTGCMTPRPDSDDLEASFAWCRENASFVQQVVIPDCNKTPRAECGEEIRNYDKANCRRWGF